MKKVRVRLGRSGYTIHIGAGLLSETGRLLRETGLDGKAIIITDPAVRDFYGTSLKQSLTAQGFKTTLLEVPEGEQHKSLETAGRLYGELAAAGAERNTPVIALGGGVIGDLAGFVAATYMRGVPFVQAPTTLLAQVDSSVGGKVAVDHGKLKNMVGAFYQPRLVVSDVGSLTTLPAEQLANGLSEVIKHAIIRDPEFFTYFEENIDRIKALDEKALEHIVARSVEIKAQVVEKDEKDLGLRNILNFGHTIGHAVESVLDFGIAHGQAVAIGMMAACRISADMGVLEKTEIPRIRKLLRRAGLRTKLPGVDVARVLEAMKHDKKVADGKVKLVLIRTLGDVFLSADVDTAIVEKALVSLR